MTANCAEGQIPAISCDGTHRLWSLWDMLATYAWHFFILGRLLERLNQRLGVPLPPAFTGMGFGSFGGLGGFALPPSQKNALALALQPSPPPPIPAPDMVTEEERKDLLPLLEILDGVCQQVGITKLSKDIERAKSAATSILAERKLVQFHVENLTNRAIDELYGQQFLHVPETKAKYYLQTDLFGSEVGKKLPKVSEDITNAGTCFALGQSTACVFHLMRVMEHCVQRFGKKLRVPLDVEKENWAQIMDHVNPAIKAMKGGKKSSQAQNRRKEKYSLAAGRLDHVRLVWRNDTMHPKATYDAAQALEVLVSVEKFLQSVAALV